MSSGLTRQALRRHRMGLAGTFVTQVLASLVISAMVMTMRSTDAALSAAERELEPTATVVGISQVFLGSSIYLAMLVVGVTMALAMAGQLRDVALVRTLGASPGQVRRSAAAQAAAVSVPAALLGFGLSIPAGAAWVALLRAQGLMPAAVTFRVEATVALPVALAVAVTTAVVAALLAALRTSRLRPGTALVEVVAGRPRIGRARTATGVVLLLLSLVLSTLLARLDTRNAGDASFFVLLAGCVGVGLCGPHLLRFACRRLRRVAGDRLARAALDDLEAQSRALSGALVPAVLAVAFAVVKVGWHTTAAHLGLAAAHADRWAEFAGTTLYCVFAAVAALNCFVTVGVNRRGDYAAMRLAGATRRSVLGMTAVQALTVTAVVVLTGAVVAVATLIPMLQVTLGTSAPHLPAATAAGGVLTVAGVVGLGMLLPAAISTLRPPLEDVARAA